MSRLTGELESQTQEAASSGAKADEHAIIRSLLGERRSHIRAVGRKVKGVGSPTASTAASHAHLYLNLHPLVPVIRWSWLLLGRIRLKHELRQSSISRG